MSNVSEQIHVEPKNVWKMVFTTICGTFVSHTMQQEDCNALAAFRWLMTVIFQDYIGRFVQVYLDNIFVYSNSIEEHEKHLELIFDELREVHLYLEESKLNLYSKRMNWLGHLIDDHSIHVDSDKMSHIHGWCTPRNKHNVQRFLRLMQYLAHFMPDVSAYTVPLAAIQKNSHPFL